jgi:hypothetical protein
VITVYAHAGHWLAGILYAAPVFVLMGWLGIVRLKDRRTLRGAAGDPDPDHDLGGRDGSPEAGPQVASRKDA